jgi:hypothetical protein
LTAAQNFLYLTPELAAQLRNNHLAQVQSALDEYELNSPRWFVGRGGGVFGEGAVNHLYERLALFQARALILQQPLSELASYLDVPAFAAGDLFYLQNLAAAIEAGG